MAAATAASAEAVEPDHTSLLELLRSIGAVSLVVGAPAKAVGAAGVATAAGAVALDYKRREEERRKKFQEKENSNLATASSAEDIGQEVAAILGLAYTGLIELVQAASLLIEHKRADATVFRVFVCCESLAEDIFQLLSVHNIREVFAGCVVDHAQRDVSQLFPVKEGGHEA